MWQFLPPPQTPLALTARSYEDLSSWCWNPGLWSGLGLGSLPPVVSFHHTWMWHCPLCHCHISAHLQVVAPSAFLDECGFLNTWFSDFHTTQFPDGSECYLFCGLVVILSVVAWGGEVSYTCMCLYFFKFTLNKNGIKLYSILHYFIACFQLPMYPEHRD